MCKHFMYKQLIYQKGQSTKNVKSLSDFRFRLITLQAIRVAYKSHLSITGLQNLASLAPIEEVR